MSETDRDLVESNEYLMSFCALCLIEVYNVSPEELQTRYVAEIDHRGSNDKYIDGVEERELMQIAIQHGFPLDQARTFLADVCREKGYVIEATVVQKIRGILEQKASEEGAIGRADFEGVVHDVAGWLANTSRNEREIRKLVVSTMDDSGINRRKPWFGFDWYTRMKRDLGLS